MSETEMKIDPARAKALIFQLQEVQQRITAVAKGRPVRLVAVSKLKPANDILALHQPAHQPAAVEGIAPQIHFGENYAQELASKAALLPPSVQWHFIGGLQSKHCKTLAKIPNLFAVSSLDSPKKADLLNRARGDFLVGTPPSERDADRQRHAQPIHVHIQVNTSGEAAKAGCTPGADVVQLARHVLTACPHLRLLGLMTIGAIARSVATTPETENEDFATLRAQRDLVAEELKEELLLAAAKTSSGGGGGGDQGGGGEATELELSMGMSEDFEGAIAMGSSEVRIGSTIFGTRPAKADAKLVE